MDYEIFLNHTVPDKTWNVYLQENHINARRGIIKTAMAYAMFQETGVQRRATSRIDPAAGPATWSNPDTVTDTDDNGPGTLPGPTENGIGEDGQPVEQRPTGDEPEVVPRRERADDRAVRAAALRPTSRADAQALERVDTLVLADKPAPRGCEGPPVDRRRTSPT